MKSQNKVTKFLMSAMLVLSTIIMLAAPAPVSAVTYTGTTTVTFSANPATLSGDAANDVTITTTTTASGGDPDLIDDGKVMIELATDGSGNPLPAASVVAWVALNSPGYTPVSGVTTLAVDLDALGFVNGTVGGFRAHYVTGGGRDKVDTHFSDPVDLTAIAGLGSISGAKFYDADTDGVWDGGEPAIEGFKIELYDDEETLLDTQFTNENGEYLFDELDAGTYTVKEVLPSSGWVNTTDDSITIEGLSGPSEDNNFGNVCIGCDGGAEGKGWWTNNGADDGTDDLPALCLLNLRDEDGDPFDPTLYGIKETGKFPEGTFAYWLQEANAVNMAYMLSAQLAAMELNVLNGFVDDEALVYAPGITSANAAGFASIADLMSEADAELGTHGTALSGDDWRDYQEALKNALDAANNNVNFVCTEPCLPIEYPVL